jgi:hypothetical protein
MIMLQSILKKQDVRDMVWINLAQDRQKWWTLVNALITFLFHKMHEISRPAEEPEGTILLYGIK